MTEGRDEMPNVVRLSADHEAMAQRLISALRADLHRQTWTLILIMWIGVLGAGALGFAAGLVGR